MNPRTLTLTEYQTAAGVALDPAEAGWLNRHATHLEVRPAWDRPGYFDLTPGSRIGTIALPSLTLHIRPKIPAERVLFLISYTLDAARWQQNSSALQSQPDVVEGMAALYGIALRTALRQGPLQGYRSKQEALNSVRGRIRFDEQLRRRFLRPNPLEVEYDDFTLDTDLNRLLFAALRRLHRLPLRSATVRSLLAHCRAAFADGVSPVELDPNRLPDLNWNRLNQRFKPAADLATAILRGTSLELEHGGLRGTAFTIDMNTVFEQFVRTALRDALGLSELTWPARPKAEHLDQERRIVLKPDLTWVENDRVVFVGDAKYKRATPRGAPNADLYQLHAYVTSLALPCGLLVYAAGEEREAVHQVRHMGTQLIVQALAVDGPPSEVLKSVGGLASLVQELRRKAEPTVGTPRRPNESGIGAGPTS